MDARTYDHDEAADGWRQGVCHSTGDKVLDKLRARVTPHQDAAHHDAEHRRLGKKKHQGSSQSPVARKNSMPLEHK